MHQSGKKQDHFYRLGCCRELHALHFLPTINKLNLSRVIYHHTRFYMGIYIRLNIIPNKISKKDWNSTYKEAEQLINSYPFLDIVSDKDTYSCSWNYADSPSEKPIKYCNDNIGFRMFGDLVTMETAESFE